MLDKFLFGNKQIPEMYFGNIPVAQVYFGNTLIWEKLVKQLVAGNQNVAIEYIPSQDISVTDIGIFTNENSTGRSPRIKIFHDCGLCVAFANGDIQTTNQEVYNLSGSNHDAVIQATTLKAGQKYYIVYSPGYGSGNTFYPAYFQNTNGNYKVYENEEENIQVFDISENAQYLKPSKYKGILSDSMGIFAFSTDDWFVWMGSTQTGMAQGQVYRRTNVGEGWIFTGIIGDPNNTHTITADDLQAIISKPPNADFIWYVDQVPNMTRGEIWGKPSNWVTPTLVDILNGKDNMQKTARILMNLTSSNSKVMISDGSLFTYNVGDTFSLKSGYTSKVVSDEPLTTLPSNTNVGDIYYLSGSIGQQVGYNDGIFVWNGSSYEIVVQWEAPNFSNYFNVENISSLLEYIGKNSDLLVALDNADYTFLNATVNTDKKFYLKLNGNEV
ncbi:MAG: hypothetical protein J6V44_16780 [Methanobrevibacter sp.]|nr:hypothetical protein [Methanobrevibacter sp.]